MKILQPSPINFFQSGWAWYNPFMSLFGAIRYFTIVALLIPVFPSHIGQISWNPLKSTVSAQGLGQSMVMSDFVPEIHIIFENFFEAHSSYKVPKMGIKALFGGSEPSVATIFEIHSLLANLEGASDQKIQFAQLQQLRLFERFVILQRLIKSRSELFSQRSSAEKSAQYLAEVLELANSISFFQELRKRYVRLLFKAVHEDPAFDPDLAEIQKILEPIAPVLHVSMAIAVNKMLREPEFGFSTGELHSKHIGEQLDYVIYPLLEFDKYLLEKDAATQYDTPDLFAKNILAENFEGLLFNHAQINQIALTKKDAPIVPLCKTPLKTLSPIKGDFGKNPLYRETINFEDRELKFRLIKKDLVQNLQNLKISEIKKNGKTYLQAMLSKIDNFLQYDINRNVIPIGGISKDYTEEELEDDALIRRDYYREEVIPFVIREERSIIKEAAADIVTNEIFSLDLLQTKVLVESLAQSFIQRLGPIVFHALEKKLLVAQNYYTKKFDNFLLRGDYPGGKELYHEIIQLVEQTFLDYRPLIAQQIAYSVGAQIQRLSSSTEFVQKKREKFIDRVLKTATHPHVIKAQKVLRAIEKYELIDLDHQQSKETLTPDDYQDYLGEMFELNADVLAKYLKGNEFLEISNPEEFMVWYRIASAKDAKFLKISKNSNFMINPDYSLFLRTFFSDLQQTFERKKKQKSSETFYKIFIDLAKKYTKELGVQNRKTIYSRNLDPIVMQMEQHAQSDAFGQAGKKTYKQGVAEIEGGYYSMLAEKAKQASEYVEGFFSGETYEEERATIAGNNFGNFRVPENFIDLRPDQSISSLAELLGSNSKLKKDLNLGSADALEAILLSAMEGQNARGLDQIFRQLSLLSIPGDKFQDQLLEIRKAVLSNQHVLEKEQYQTFVRVYSKMSKDRFSDVQEGIFELLDVLGVVDDVFSGAAEEANEVGELLRVDFAKSVKKETFEIPFKPKMSVSKTSHYQQSDSRKSFGRLADSLLDQKILAEERINQAHQTEPMLAIITGEEVTTETIRSYTGQLSDFQNSVKDKIRGTFGTKQNLDILDHLWPTMSFLDFSWKIDKHFPKTVLFEIANESNLRRQREIIEKYIDVSTQNINRAFFQVCEAANGDWKKNDHFKDVYTRSVTIRNSMVQTAPMISKNQFTQDDAKKIDEKLKKNLFPVQSFYEEHEDIVGYAVIGAVIIDAIAILLFPLFGAAHWGTVTAAGGVLSAGSLRGYSMFLFGAAAPYLASTSILNVKKYYFDYPAQYRERLALMRTQLERTIISKDDAFEPIAQKNDYTYSMDFFMTPLEIAFLGMTYHMVRVSSSFPRLLKNKFNLSKTENLNLSKVYSRDVVKSGALWHDLKRFNFKAIWRDLKPNSQPIPKDLIRMRTVSEIHKVAKSVALEEKFFTKSITLVEERLVKLKNLVEVQIYEISKAEFDLLRIIENTNANNMTKIPDRVFSYTHRGRAIPEGTGSKNFDPEWFAKHFDNLDDLASTHKNSTNKEFMEFLSREKQTYHNPAKATEFRVNDFGNPTPLRTYSEEELLRYKASLKDGETYYYKRTSKTKPSKNGDPPSARLWNFGVENSHNHRWMIGFQSYLKTVLRSVFINFPKKIKQTGKATKNFVRAVTRNPEHEFSFHPTPSFIKNMRNDSANGTLKTFEDVEKLLKVEGMAWKGFSKPLNEKFVLEFDRFFADVALEDLSISKLKRELKLHHQAVFSIGRQIEAEVYLEQIRHLETAKKSLQNLKQIRSGLNTTEEGVKKISGRNLPSSQIRGPADIDDISLMALSEQIAKSKDTYWKPYKKIFSEHRMASSFAARNADYINPQIRMIMEQGKATENSLGAIASEGHAAAKQRMKKNFYYNIARGKMPQESGWKKSLATDFLEWMSYIHTYHFSKIRNVKLSKLVEKYNKMYQEWLASPYYKDFRKFYLRYHYNKVY